MKIFLFSFKMTIKTAGSAKKIRVGRVSRNTAIFSALLKVLDFFLKLIGIKYVQSVHFLLNKLCNRNNNYTIQYSSRHNR